MRTWRRPPHGDDPSPVEGTSGTPGGMAWRPSNGESTIQYPRRQSPRSLQPFPKVFDEFLRLVTLGDNLARSDRAGNTPVRWKPRRRFPRLFAPAARANLAAATMLARPRHRRRATGSVFPTATPELFVQFPQLRKLLLAGRAPACPEVHHRVAPAAVREMPGVSSALRKERAGVSPTAGMGTTSAAISGIARSPRTASAVVTVTRTTCGRAGRRGSPWAWRRRPPRGRIPRRARR